MSEDMIPLTMDDEVRAMLLIASGLNPIDVAAQKRVMKWAEDRFGLGVDGMMLSVARELSTAATAYKVERARLIASGGKPDSVIENPFTGEKGAPDAR